MMDEQEVFRGSGLALHRQTVEDEIARLEMMMTAGLHGGLKAHLFEEVEALRGELDAIDDLILQGEE